MQVFGWCKPICICHSDPTNSQLYQLYYISLSLGTIGSFFAILADTFGWHRGDVNTSRGSGSEGVNPVIVFVNEICGVVQGAAFGVHT